MAFNIGIVPVYAENLCLDNLKRLSLKIAGNMKLAFYDRDFPELSLGERRVNRY